MQVGDNWWAPINNFHFLCLSPQICAARPPFNGFNGFTRFNGFLVSVLAGFNCSVGFTGFQEWSGGKFNCGGQKPSGIARSNRIVIVIVMECVFCIFHKKSCCVADPIVSLSLLDYTFADCALSQHKSLNYYDH